MSAVTDTIAIEIDDSTIKFIFNSDYSSGWTVLKGGELEDSLIKISPGNSTMRNNFSLRYLNLFNKAAILGERL